LIDVIFFYYGLWVFLFVIIVGFMIDLIVLFDFFFLLDEYFLCGWVFDVLFDEGYCFDIDVDGDVVVKV